MKKQNSLIMITILALLALFANISAIAQDSDSELESSSMQVESSDESGTISSSPTYVSDDEEEETMTTTTEDDSSFVNSADSDI